MLALMLAGASPVSAAVVNAPALSKATAQSANPLQRAAWACEAGGQASSSGHVRYFLGTVDHSAGLGDQPPLVLTNGVLTGLGQISNNSGWYNIRFSCSLAPTLDKARSFTSTVLSPVRPNNATPGPSIPTAAGHSWYVTPADRFSLVHGVKETDDRDFLAICAAKSGKIDIRLAHTAPWLAAGGYATIAITSNGKSLLYVARGVMDDNLGVVIPVLSVAPDDWLFTQMAAASDLAITMGADIVYAVQLQGAAAPVRSFVAGCGRG